MFRHFIIFCVFIFSSISIAETPFKKFSMAISGWTSNRTFTDWQALNSVLNTSPGEYSHLRGGEIDDEKTGPNVFISANYFLNKDVAINIGIGYEPGETTARFVENSAPHSMYWKSRYVYLPVI